MSAENLDSGDDAHQDGQGDHTDDDLVKKLVAALNKMRIQKDSTNVLITCSDGHQCVAHSLLLESTSNFFAELIEVSIKNRKLFLFLFLFSRYKMCVN
jgi:hypothetical protein